MFEMVLEAYLVRWARVSLTHSQPKHTTTTCLWGACIFFHTDRICHTTEVVVFPSWGVVAGLQAASVDSKAVMKKLKDVQARGRKRLAFG